MSDTNYTYWYDTGSVTCNKGSTTVRGTGTYWETANIKPGDIFTVDGTKIYQVREVVSSAQITLSKAYGETSFTGGSYGVIRNFTATLPAEIAAKVTQLLNKHEKLINEELSTIQGENAYEVAKNNGFSGTESEWLASLTAYGVAKSAGYTGTVKEWLTSITAYGQAVAEGYTGTRAQWLESLKAAGEWTSARDRLSTLESADTSKGQRITTLEGSSTDYGKRIKELETSQKTQDTSITTLQTTSTDYGTRIGTLETTSTAYGGRITQTENTGTNHEGRITDLETSSGTHTTKITALEGDDANHATRLTTLENDMAQQKIVTTDFVIPKSYNIKVTSAIQQTLTGSRHNSVVRGKSLGNTITDAQYATIQSGKFEDMYLGDYWTIPVDGTNKRFTIGHFNYNPQYVSRVSDYGEDDDPATVKSCSRSNIVLLCEYNPGNPSPGSCANGYYGSAYRTTGWLAQFREKVEEALGDKMGYYGETLDSAITDGQVTASVWCNCRFEHVSIRHYLGYLPYGLETMWKNIQQRPVEQLAYFKHIHPNIGIGSSRDYLANYKQVVLHWGLINCGTHGWVCVCMCVIA